MSPEQLLREFEADGRIVVGDLEAGLGTMLRLGAGTVDVVVVVAQPTAKAIEVARRAALVARERAGRLVVVANRVRGDEDVEAIREGVGPDAEVVRVPDDAAVADADARGVAPIDFAPGSPGVMALRSLARTLAAPSPEAQARAPLRRSRAAPSSRGSATNSS